MYYSGNRRLTMDEMKINAQFIYEKLFAAGWTINAIAGVFGNLETESTFNPAVWEGLDEGNVTKGFGLVQWTPATNYLDWCSSSHLVTLSTPEIPESDVAFYNPFDRSVHIRFSSSPSQVKKNGQIKTLINGLITLNQNDSITLIYSELPSWEWFDSMDGT
jgi:hypothetical protein